jgi:hypothetical protein
MPIAAGGTPRGFKGRGAGFELGACGFRLFFFPPRAGSREPRVASCAASCELLRIWGLELGVAGGRSHTGFLVYGPHGAMREFAGHCGPPGLLPHTRTSHVTHARTAVTSTSTCPCPLPAMQPLLSHEPPRAGEPPVPRLPVPNCSPLSLIIRSQSLCRALGLSPPAHQASDNQQGLKQETGGFGLRARARGLRICFGFWTRLLLLSRTCMCISPRSPHVPWPQYQVPGHCSEC